LAVEEDDVEEDIEDEGVDAIAGFSCSSGASSGASTDSVWLAAALEEGVASACLRRSRHPDGFDSTWSATKPVGVVAPATGAADAV
jgi:hypothetical protein